jgi:arylsulfatase A-like enzyme
MVFEEDYIAPITFREANHWLEYYHDKVNPFFLLIDTWDPHEPWDPPRWYTELYKSDYDGRVIIPPYSKIEESGFPKEDVEIAHACYCGEITMVDEWVGHLLRKLENMQLMDDTIIIFTSDHGFYFGEHGVFGKAIKKEYKDYLSLGYTKGEWIRCPLYEEVVRIPLIVYHPDEKPKRIDALTSSIDLMPTILDLLKIEKPSTIQGKSTIQAVQGDDFGGRDFVVSSHPLFTPGATTRIVDEFKREVKEWLPHTITTSEWSLIYSVKGQESELYNLKKDPRQEKNVIGEYQDIARQLHQNFLSILKSSKTNLEFLEPRKEITF